MEVQEGPSRLGSEKLMVRSLVGRERKEKALACLLQGAQWASLLRGFKGGEFRGGPRESSR